MLLNDFKEKKLEKEKHHKAVACEISTKVIMFRYIVYEILY